MMCYDRKEEKIDSPRTILPLQQIRKEPQHMALKTPDPAKVRILFNQRVPMRDGITLSADVYLPVGEPARRPVILSRTPYLKSDMITVTRAQEFVKRGYAYVAMDVRAR